MNPPLPAPDSQPQGMFSSLLRPFRLARYQRHRKRLLDSIYSRYQDSTMVPRELFAANLVIAESVQGIEGSVVECGVWKGGMSGAMAELLGPARDYYLFDSFEGLPPAREIDGPAARKWQEDKNSRAYFDNCSASADQATAALGRSPAVKVHVVKGWFDRTVPSCIFSAPIALLRLDGDWYDSTATCLEHLFPKVALGGKIIIDDYYTWSGCSRAVHDYLSHNKLPERIEVMPPGVAFITKTCRE